jgi:short-subunit dehydrogenase
MKKLFALFITLLTVVTGYAQGDAGTINVPGRILFDTVQTVSSVVPGSPDTMKTSNIISGNDRPFALVAGGSKGIGYAIAQALAKRGYNLILIARHVDSLVAAKNKLESAYPIHVELLAYDLSLNETATEIAQWCTARDIPLKMLCNVAGFGGAKDYLSLPLDTLRYMINLNIGSAMALSLTLLPLLEKNAPSYILNVASMAGFAPIPVKNMYSATKSAIIFFSYSLRYQLKKKNISVSVLCPGPVFTKPSIIKDTKDKLGWLGMQMAVSPERVGEIAVRKTLKKKLVIVPGALSKMMSILVRLLPRRMIVSIYNRVAHNQVRIIHHKFPD